MKRVAQHLLVQIGELFEDHVKQEPLWQSKCVHSRQGYIVELGAFAAKHVIVTECGKACLFYSDYVPIPDHVFWVLLIVFL